MSTTSPRLSWTPTRTEPPSADPDPWISQTPQNQTDALSQTTLVENRIVRHQGIT
jgi:hypothetical protein